MPAASWGRIKRERIARSSYLAALARRRRTTTRRRRAVRRSGERLPGRPALSEEYALSLAAAGLPAAEEPAADERAAALAAIGAAEREDRIEKYEEYLRRFPEGGRAVEIGIRLVEEYAKTKGNEANAVRVAERIAAGTDDPEVLSALAFLLADAGVGVDRAVAYGSRATACSKKR